MRTRTSTALCLLLALESMALADPQLSILPSSSLPGYGAGFLHDGERGRQARHDYWNDGTAGLPSDTIVLQPGIRLLAPVMDTDGPHVLNDVSVSVLDSDGRTRVLIEGETLTAAPTAEACTDITWATEDALEVCLVVVRFGDNSMNRDGWNFLGEIEVLDHQRKVLAMVSADMDTPTVPPSTRPLSIQEAYAWLEAKADDMIRRCARPTPAGLVAYPPQVGIHYEAFWLRDYAYILEARSTAIPAEDLRAACRFLLGGQREDGAMVDCILFDGTPIYQPGLGTMGDNPVADGSQFAVSVVWCTVEQTGDQTLAAECLPTLRRGLDAVPRNPGTGLVHIRPGGYDRCPYGFTDTVRKEGDLLFSSLLLVQALERYAGLAEGVGQDAEAAWARADARNLSGTIRGVFWDEALGLFRAATVQCREPDVWGSAFAVYIGVADEEQSRHVAECFRDQYHGMVQRGQVRHLPAGVYWEVARERDHYQNGAYWATPSGWFAYALSRVDPDLAADMILDLVEDFRERRPCEWVFDRTTQLPEYMASCTLPLAALRRMIGEGKL
jgi:hypothetical protein